MLHHRCEAFRLLHETGENEAIAYLDVNSLYPSILRGTSGRPFPTGIPIIVTKDFTELHSYFGIAHVRITPPLELELPVLPLQIEKKVYYALCRSCAVAKASQLCQHSGEDRSFDGVFTTPELELAQRYGYKVAELYEVWHYPNTSSTLFTSFIDRFYKLKVQNSGWPKTCQTSEQQDRYLMTLEERYGIGLQREDIEENPTQRLIAKIMLNSSWVRIF